MLIPFLSLSYYGNAYLDKKFKIFDSNKVKVIYNFVRYISYINKLNFSIWIITANQYVL